MSADPVTDGDDRPFRLGFLTHLQGAGDATEVYRNAVELFVAAEELGFDSGWVAQHHFEPVTGRLPSPFPFLAAVGERTRTIRLGTAVLTLPLEDPLRVAEDAAVVDALSGGRLELGVGSGFDLKSFTAFGRNIDQHREENSAALERLRSILAGDPVYPDGPTLQPPPGGIGQRIWQAAFSAEGARYVAGAGTRLLLNRAVFYSEESTGDVQAPWAAAYIEDWAHPVALRSIGLSRGVYPAKDEAQARREFGPGTDRAIANFVASGRFPAGQSAEEYYRRLHITYGSSEQVATGLKNDRALRHATDLICQFSPAVPTLDQAIGVLERMAREVAPELGWRPSRDLTGALR